MDAKPYTTKYQFLREFPYDNKLLLLAEFLCDFVTRENIVPSTKRVYIHHYLLYLSRFLHHKHFRQVTRDDILSYITTTTTTTSPAPPKGQPPTAAAFSAAVYKPVI
jgi:hypothetical protein